MKEEELNDLKYRELQKLAKENGVKANLPKSALIAALLEVFEANKDSTELTESKNQSDVPSQENISNIPAEADADCEVKENAPKSRKNSRKKDSDQGSKIQSEQPSQAEIPNIPAEADCEMKENAPNSRRNSRKKHSDPVLTNSKDKKSIGNKKSFDQEALDAEIAKVEQMANDIMEGMAPRVRSTRNSSSVEAAATQIDRTDTPVEEEKNKSIHFSRRNSRISRLFDKEAFDVEAAKVSRFAQEIVNSPRKRSSILNLTPVMKGATASAVNSPLVLQKLRQSLMTPSQKRPSTEMTPKLTDAKKRKVTVNSPIVSLKNRQSLMTPSQKRPSTEMTPKLTDAKKRKVVVTKPTPGSVTKPKEKTTGIPRPKVRKVPDFAKLHAKQFGKMDNLDQYLGKKKDRMATLTPGPKSQSKPQQKSPRKNLVTEIPKANFNFGGKSESTTSKKPFVFKGNNPKPKTPKAVLTPGPKSQVRSQQKSPRKNLVTEVPKANFNFGGKSDSTTSKKPFVFKANNQKPKSPANKILNNITNKSSTATVGDKKATEGQTSYRPYTGKVKPWNAKDSSKNRQEMAKKIGGKTKKEQQMSHIKGVRMNKRMELMLQKRNVKN